MKKNLIGVGPFDILRSRVILLQNKCLTENLEIQLDFDRSELQKICLHEEVVELMSSHKHGEKRFTVSNGRICLGCGLKELVNGMNGRFYRILLGHSFFANFSNLGRLENLLKNPTSSKFVFRNLRDLLDKNEVDSRKP